jgi:hypothetical protein
MRRGPFPGRHVLRRAEVARPGPLSVLLLELPKRKMLHISFWWPGARTVSGPCRMTRYVPPGPCDQFGGHDLLDVVTGRETAYVLFVVVVPFMPASE